MTENDVPRYELELIRSSEAITDVVNDTNQYTAPQIVYASPSNQSGGNTAISANMVIIVLAVVIGIVAIAYSRNCNCGK